MKIDFIGYQWNVYRGELKGFRLLPNSANVYMIVIKSPVFKRRKIAYIGVTKNLRTRLNTHVVLSEFRFSKANFIVEIFYKDFGLDLNDFIEVELIKRHKPPFEGSIRMPIEYKLYNKYKFWKELGVKRVQYGKDEWRRDRYTVDFNLNKYHKKICNGISVKKANYLYQNRVKIKRNSNVLINS